MSKAISLSDTYIHLRGDGSARTMEGGDKFWAGIAQRTDLETGRLMCKMSQSSDWNHWERHPAGEEILILLSGEIELVLETPQGEERVLVKAGETFVMPKGVWHRAVVHKPGELMFITPGAGTEHKPV